MPHHPDTIETLAAWTGFALAMTFVVAITVA